MSEQNLWNRLRTGVSKHGHWNRVENMVGVGIPDVNYCLPAGIEGWLELKFRKEPPARPTTAAFTNGGLRDDQIIWINRRAQLGGRVHIFAQVGDVLLLVPGRYATEFNSMTLDYMRMCSVWVWTGRSPEWNSFTDALTRS